MKSLAIQKSPYELKRFENIILNDLPDFFKRTPDLEQEFIPDFQITITKEVQSIKENLLLSPIVLDDPRDLRRYIQFHQHNLFILAGRLLDYTQPEHLNNHDTPDIKTFGQILYRAIQDLLDFLQTHFPQHFDHNAWIPADYQRIARHHLGADLPTIRIALLQYGITLELVSIAMLPLRHFVQTDSSNHTTFRQIAYLKHLKAELAALPAIPAEKPNKRLHELLHRLNFNSPEYVDYCTTYISHQVDNVALSSTASTAMLYRYRKLLLQNRIAPGLVLNPAHTSLQEAIGSWLEIEIWHDELNMQLQNLIPDTAGATALLSKLITTLTGAQLAYLFGLLQKQGVITNQNKKQLGIILATVFQTATDAKKGDSYRQQFYRTDTRPKEIVEGILAKMLQQVRDDLANDALK
jgi:hypothetical protein